MKTISRRICGVLLGLFVLGLIVPVARADDDYHRQWQQWREEQDRANQQAQAEQAARDRAYQEAQAEQAARDRAYQEQAARDRAYQEAQAEQAARDSAYYEQQKQREAEARERQEQESWAKSAREWQQWQEDARKYWDDQQKQKEWDEWYARLTGSADWSPPASDSSAPQASAVRQAPRAQVQSFVPAAPPRRPLPLNPVAFRQMVLQRQAQVRQYQAQVLQLQARVRQQIMQEPPAAPQMIQNPFVRPSP